MTLGGLTLTGFIAPTVEEIVTDINTQVLTNIDAGLDLSPDQPIGQIIGIVAEKIAEVYEVVATVYNSMNPDAADGQLLDNVSAITGTRRRSAKYSYVTATLGLNAGVTVPAGSIASVAGQADNRWVSTASGHNAGGSPAAIDVLFRSEQLGPFVANSGTLTVIATPVVGWNTVTNALDAAAGIITDTDATLRIERQAELAASGSGTVDAMRAAVLLVPGVLQCSVFENVTNVIDANNLPPHSMQVTIWDGASPAAGNDTIAQAIWNNKPGGIQMVGGISATAVDAIGVNRTMQFNRAIAVPIYMSLTSTPSTITSAQRTAIKAAMAAYGQAVLNLGVDVIALAFKAIPLSVVGISDVPVFTLGVAPAPVGTANIAITDVQIATLDTSHILVDGS